MLLPVIMCSQFEEYISTIVAENHSTFVSFNPHDSNYKVDVLLYESMAKNQHYKLLWGVI